MYTAALDPELTSFTSPSILLDTFLLFFSSTFHFIHLVLSDTRWLHHASFPSYSLLLSVLGAEVMLGQYRVYNYEGIRQ